MSVKKSEIKPYKKKINLLTEQPSFFTISPVYVLIISVFFIGTVFMLHIFGKFSVGSSHVSGIVAFVAVVCSVVYAYIVHKRK